MTSRKKLQKQVPKFKDPKKKHTPTGLSIPLAVGERTPSSSSIFQISMRLSWSKTSLGAVTGRFWSLSMHVEPFHDHGRNGKCQCVGVQCSPTQNSSGHQLSFSIKHPYKLSPTTVPVRGSISIYVFDSFLLLLTFSSASHNNAGWCKQSFSSTWRKQNHRMNMSGPMVQLAVRILEPFSRVEITHVAELIELPLTRTQALVSASVAAINVQRSGSYIISLWHCLFSWEKPSILVFLVHVFERNLCF